MILCQWHGDWFLSTGINWGRRRCWLRCGAKMPHNETFQPLPPVGMQLYGFADNPDSVIFYPELYYRGCRIWPQWWDSERQDPILRCIALPSNLEDLDSDYLREITRRINARYAGDVLIADGWEQIGRGEYVKFLHVDEIEKVEGPPPEGPF